MAAPHSKSGLLYHADGRVDRARFYHGDGEPPPRRLLVDPADYATWMEVDGTVGIRRGTTVSIGATTAYSTNYDSLDWGN